MTRDIARVHLKKKTKKTSCSSRHRVKCKNGNKCIFKASRSCEFLHIKKSPGHENNLKYIENSFGKIKAMVRGIEDETVIITQQLHKDKPDCLSWKKMCTNINKWKKKNEAIRSRKQGNKKSMQDKFEELYSQAIILQNKINKEVKLNEFKCFICNKEFRNRTTLGNHDKKIQL